MKSDLRNYSLFIVHCSLLLALVGCNKAQRDAFYAERAESLYRSAMDDLQAGRVDEAVNGFKKVLKANPANASARFQLAALQQDVQKDFLGAVVNFREFLLLAESSEKAKIASDRLASCERELVNYYSRRSGKGGAIEATEAGKLKNSLKTAEKRNAELSTEVAKLREENAKLLKRLSIIQRNVQSVGGVEDDAKPPTPVDLKAILDNEESSEPVAENLLADELAEENEDNSDLLPQQTKDNIKENAFARPAKPVKAEPEHEPRPPEYVVQEGDTLYKIAVRFYGVRSAWNKIREANKATITTDGRVKAGQKIKLP